MTPFTASKVRPAWGYSPQPAASGTLYAYTARDPTFPRWTREQLDTRKNQAVLGMKEKPRELGRSAGPAAWPGALCAQVAEVHQIAGLLSTFGGKPPLFGFP